MTEKWVEYALAGINLYIIIDSHDVSGDNKSHVIFRHLDQSLNQRAKQHLSAFPDRMNRSKIKKFYTLASKYKSELYHKSEFTEDDVINIGFFQGFNSKANEVDSPTYLRGRLEQEWQRCHFSPNEIQLCRDSEECINEVLSEHQKAMSKVRAELADAMQRWETERLAKEGAIVEFDRKDQELDRKDQEL